MLFFSYNSYAQEGSSKVVQGPFKTNLFPGGEIYFEKGKQDINSCEPTKFILKYKNNNQVKIKKIDEYGSDPFCPELVSVFFYKIHNKDYIFVIIKRHIDLWMEKIDMDEYQVIAYKNENGILAKDDKISKDPRFSGDDGIFHDRNKIFKYKTAADVKRYLKQKYY